MKKIKLLLVTIFVLLFGITNVNAMTLKPTGANSGKRGSEITLYITLNRTSSEKIISAVDGKFSYDSNILTLSKTEKIIGENWSQFSGVSNNGTFSYANITFDDLITSASKNIVKVLFKINDNASYGNTTISISDPSATDEEGNDVTISGGSHTVKVLSDVNTLTNLTISGGTINFNENTTTYDLEINDTSVDIKAIKKDINSTISGDIGTKTLNYGTNIFKITVTSESGTKKVYTLNITRPDNRSKVNTLSSLKLSEGNLSFDKDILTYNITVKNDITKIDIIAELTDIKSNFVSGYGNRVANLKEGKNVIEIKVKAENEKVRTYTINVTRKSNKSSNNYLSELKLSHGTIDFDKETLEYEISVIYDIDNIEIEAKTEDAKATYEIKGNEDLKIGTNTINIKVLAEDQSEREYKIIVTRKKQNEELSSNSKLNILTIDGYDIDFNSTIYQYNLKIKDETSLIINYTKEEPTSNVNIKGNSDLKNGSVITISVIAENGSETIYSINIQKEENNNLLMFIPIGILVLIIIIIVVVLKKKNNNNKPEDTNSISNNEISNNNPNSEMTLYNNEHNNLQLNNQMINNIQPTNTTTVDNNNVNNNITNNITSNYKINSQENTLNNSNNITNNQNNNGNI